MSLVSTQRREDTRYLDSQQLQAQHNGPRRNGKMAQAKNKAARPRVSGIDRKAVSGQRRQLEHAAPKPGRCSGTWPAPSNTGRNRQLPNKWKGGAERLTKHALPNPRYDLVSLSHGASQSTMHVQLRLGYSQSCCTMARKAGTKGRKALSGRSPLAVPHSPAPNISLVRLVRGSTKGTIKLGLRRRGADFLLWSYRGEEPSGQVHR